MLHMCTPEEVLQKIKVQPNTSIPILILLQAGIERESIISMHSQKHTVA